MQKKLGIKEKELIKSDISLRLADGEKTHYYRVRSSDGVHQVVDETRIKANASFWNHEIKDQ